MSRRGAQLHPSLPQELLKTFKSDPVIVSLPSAIYEDRFEEFRSKVLSGKAPCVTEVVRPLPGHRPPSPPETLIPKRIVESVDNFRSGDRKTFLHLAAKKGDIPLAHEIIRMGIPLDYKDKDGVTPLFLALEYLYVLSKVTAASKDMPMPQTGAIADTLRSPYWSSTAERITRVASLIIEQHADVNLGQFGRTPLSLATDVGNWKLVELLLRHGAHRPPIAHISFATSTDKSLYLALVKKVKLTTPRPPQLCPCWSGQLLSKCHGQNSQPYPADFLCRCGRHKTYRNCCAKRAFKMEEEWDQDNKCISTVEVRKLSVPEVPVEFAEDFDAGGQVFREGLAQIQSDPELCREMLGKLAATKAKFFGDALGDEVDPAYAFASNSNDFFPRPWAGQISRQECKIRMDEWNKAVDQYIALGKDKRAKSQIELEAKIGMSGGPLYRYCEASDCPRVEGRDVEKMKCCSGCKLIMYCSEVCQVADWKEHKADCKSRKHREQQLPSQLAYEKLLTVMQIHAGMNKPSSGIF